MSADWISALARECEATSQGKVAKRLGVSPAMINQALKGAYRGNLARLEERVRGEFLQKTVTCPVLAEISTRRCQDEQAQPFSTSSRLAVALHRACQSCVHRRKEAA